MTKTLHNRLGTQQSRTAHYTVPAIVCGLAMIVALQIVRANDGLSSQLQSSQETEGLSLVSGEGNSLGVFLFTDHRFHETRILPTGVVGRDVNLTSDGDQLAFGLIEKPSVTPPILAIANADGTNLRKFPSMTEPGPICWSPRKDRLALWASKTDLEGGSKTSGIWVFRIDTGEADSVAAHGSVSCPAWSPDGAKFVYSENDGVSIYDTDAKSSRRLADGDYPTWSPDGKWIAVSRGKAYWLLDPESGVGKVLFTQKNAFTPLWWSPDSRYVAYATRVGVSLSVVEQADLWVRRIHDGADEKVKRFPWKGPVPDIQWVRSSPLFARAKSTG
jgi:dipeptidyl aminopeptidase/acylaminoacyl peptidase